MARFYDPATGQFTTRDPINALTRSAYGYVYGDPLNNTDPTGMYCITGVTGHDANGDEICNGAGQAALNVASTVATTAATPAAALLGQTAPPDPITNPAGGVNTALNSISNELAGRRSWNS